MNVAEKTIAKIAKEQKKLDTLVAKRYRPPVDVLNNFWIVSNFLRCKKMLVV